MANTIQQTITRAEGWKDIATGPKKGVHQNTGAFSFRFKEVSATPGDSDQEGHILAPGDSMEYDIKGGAKISIRCLTGDGILTSTDD